MSNFTEIEVTGLSEEGRDPTAMAFWRCSETCLNLEDSLREYNATDSFKMRRMHRHKLTHPDRKNVIPTEGLVAFRRFLGQPWLVEDFSYNAQYHLARYHHHAEINEVTPKVVDS